MIDIRDAEYELVWRLGTSHLGKRWQHTTDAQKHALSPGWPQAGGSHDLATWEGVARWQLPAWPAWLCVIGRVEAGLRRGVVLA